MKDSEMQYIYLQRGSHSFLESFSSTIFSNRKNERCPQRFELG
jgi:hypothetical protein